MHISNYEKSHKLKFKKLYYDFSHLHFEFPANNNGPMKSVKIKTRKQKKSCGAALSPIKMATNYQNSL